jgi:hypothetical protein
MTSLPERTAGIAFVWIGVGVEYPTSSRVRSRVGDKPREEKVIMLLLDMGFNPILE